MERILAIDDSRTVLAALQAWLVPLGFQVECYSNPAQALEAALQSPPDLLLLDIEMPGLSGFDLCRTFKNHASTASVPIVFLSGQNEPMSRIRAFQEGAVDFIGKPVQEQELKVRVRLHMQMARAQKELQAVQKQVRDIAHAKSQLLLALGEEILHWSSAEPKPYSQRRISKLAQHAQWLAKLETGLSYMQPSACELGVLLKKSCSEEAQALKEYGWTLQTLFVADFPHRYHIDAQAFRMLLEALIARLHGNSQEGRIRLRADLETLSENEPRLTLTLYTAYDRSSPPTRTGCLLEKRMAELIGGSLQYTQDADTLTLRLELPLEIAYGEKPDSPPPDVLLYAGQNLALYSHLLHRLQIPFRLASDPHSLDLQLNKAKPLWFLGDAELLLHTAPLLEIQLAQIKTNPGVQLIAIEANAQESYADQLFEQGFPLCVNLPTLERFLQNYGTSAKRN